MVIDTTKLQVQTKQFSELKRGEVFRLAESAQNSIWMKVSSNCTDQINAVYLNDGSTTYLEPVTQVVVYNAKIVLTYVAET